MIIEEQDFRLTSCGDANHLFDLEMIKTIKPKGGQPREEMTLIGYGMPIERAILKVINNRIERKKEVLTLKEYVNYFKEFKKDLSYVFTSCKE